MKLISKYIISAFITLFLSNVLIIGQSLDDYLIIAGRNNPGLKSKFLQYQAALEKIPQVGALPDPQLSLGIFIKPMEQLKGNQVAEISLMQMFPWFGTLGAAKDEMYFMAKAMFEEFNEAKSMLFYEVKATWYAMYLLENEILITEENIQLLNSIEQIAISRFKSGGQGGGSNPQGNGRVQNTGQGTNSDMGAGMRMNIDQANVSSGRMDLMEDTDDMGESGSMIDVLRLQMEINALKNNLVLLSNSKPPLLARFNQLLNRSPNEPVILGDSIYAAKIPYPLNEIPDSILLNNPMLRMFAQKESALIAQGNMNRKMGFPMVGVGLQYGIFTPRQDTEPMLNGMDMLMPMATVTIPLWRKKYNASVREADFMRQMVVVQIQDESNKLLVDYKEALNNFNEAGLRYKFYLHQTNLANQTLNILLVQYKTASTNIEEVLRMQQQLLDYRLNKLVALVDNNMAVAMIERLMGR